MATPFDVGTVRKPTLRDVRNTGEYATLFRWYVDFSSAVQVLGLDQTLAHHLNAVCRSTGVPGKTIDIMNIFVRGHRHYQPGRVIPIGKIDMHFYETINNFTMKFLYGWQQKIWQYNTGKSVPYNQLVADEIKITRLNNQDEPICTYHLLWAFLEDYTPPNLDGSTSGPMDTAVSLSYNDFYITGNPQIGIDFVDVDMNSSLYNLPNPTQ